MSPKRLSNVSLLQWRMSGPGGTAAARDPDETSGEQRGWQTLPKKNADRGTLSDASGQPSSASTQRRRTPTTGRSSTQTTLS